MTIKSIHAMDIKHQNEKDEEIAALRKLIAEQAAKMDRMTHIMKMQTECIVEMQKERCGG